jgi:hypothetical protein
MRGIYRADDGGPPDNEPPHLYFGDCAYCWGNGWEDGPDDDDLGYPIAGPCSHCAGRTRCDCPACRDLQFLYSFDIDLESEEAP